MWVKLLKVKLYPITFKFKFFLLKTRTPQRYKYKNKNFDSFQNQHFIDCFLPILYLYWTNGNKFAM